VALGVEICDLCGRTYEIDANGGNVTLGVSIIRETKQEARLSDSRVTNQQELEQVIAVGQRKHVVSE